MIFTYAEIGQLKPKVIFLLGKQVATFILSKFGLTQFRLDEDFNYHGYEAGEVFIPIFNMGSFLFLSAKSNGLLLIFFNIYLNLNY